MQYQLFLQELTENIHVPYAENAVLKVQTIHKSNSLKIKAVALFQETKRLTPWIYMAPFYRLLREGISFTAICRELESVLGMCVLSEDLPEDLFLSLSSALPLLRMRLIPRKGNEKMLLSVPHRDFFDMAVIYHLLIPCKSEHIGSAILYSDHCLLWGVTEDILFQAVLKNQEETNDYRVEKLSNVLEKSLSMSYPETGLYMLTNRVGYYGACAVLLPKAIREAAQMLGGNGYILPASIHEVLLIAEHMAPPVENLRRMVWEVNHTELLPEEVLSNEVYRYDGEKGTVTEAER